MWFAAILLFGQTTTLALGLVLLFAAGFVQSFCLTPLAAVMLRSSDEAMRGRVMGVRMLAIWGLPLGLLAAGPLIERFGYARDHLAVRRPRRWRRRWRSATAGARRCGTARPRPTPLTPAER